MNRAGADHRNRDLAVATLLVTAAYVALRQSTWSLDGCLHTLASVRSADDSASGHLLLRAVEWGWTSLWLLVGPLPFAQRYDVQQVLFGVFGVTGLMLLFAVARRRVGAASAGLALVAVAMTRDAERQITTLDEKPLGMLLFAVAIVATERLFRRLASRPGDPTLRDVLPAGLAWLLAGFGHLQNVPFAAAALVGLLPYYPGPRRVPRWAGLVLRLAPVLGLASLALFALLYVQAGGLSALPRLVAQLFVGRGAPAAPSGLLALGKASVLGGLKAFFIVDRLSPAWARYGSVAGLGVVLVAVALGAKRSRDPLTLVLAGGSLALMLLISAANYFPDYGDSYTMLVMAAFVPLAAAPRPWLAAATAVLLVVNLPAAIDYARPETTQQRHLARMIQTQVRYAAPWVLLRELTPFDREQGLSPVYYAMSEGLAHERDSLAMLPPGRFLLELPQVIEPDGSTPPGRVHEVQRELAARGRTSMPARLWDPLRTVRSDFRRYGDYLLVEPAAPDHRSTSPGSRGP